MTSVGEIIVCGLQNRISKISKKKLKIWCWKLTI